MIDDEELTTLDRKRLLKLKILLLIAFIAITVLSVNEYAVMQTLVKTPCISCLGLGG